MPIRSSRLRSKVARTTPRALAYIVAACAAASSTFAAADQDPISIVGQSIGNDLSIDLSFGDTGYTIVNYNDADGTDDEAVRIVPADDGGYWMIGFHAPDQGFQSVAISKLAPSGLVDPTFGDGGKITAATDVNLISDGIFANDRFYIAGMHLLSESGPGEFAVACLNPDATPCADFGDGGSQLLALSQPGLTSGATRILYRDGALFAIGNTDPGGSSGYSSAAAIVKLDATTGALDTTFGDGSGPFAGTTVFDPNLYPDGFDDAHALAFASNGDLLVGGSSQTAQGNASDGYVLALDPDTGVADNAFGTNGVVYFAADLGVHFDQVVVTAFHVASSGRILVAGDANHDDEFFNTLTNVLLASLEPDGTPTAAFGTNGIVNVNVGLNTETLDVAVFGDGGILVSLSSNGLVPNDYTPDGLESFVEFDATGSGPFATMSIEYPSSVGPTARANSLLVDSQDRVVAAGFRLWDYTFPIPDSDHAVTRLLRDRVFAGGFDI